MEAERTLLGTHETGTTRSETTQNGEPPPDSPDSRRRVLERVVIVSGLSGAGKSQALKVLEDCDYYCVDNLPLELLRSFLELTVRGDGVPPRVAIGMDVRARQRLDAFPAAFSALREEGFPITVLFLEADDKTLFSRYRETRRPHPLEASGSIPELVAREREALEPIRSVADHVVDTSSLSIHELRRRLVLHYEPQLSGAMKLMLISFGYRFGVPFEADLVFDVRFLPNPHFVPHLRPKDGRDADVSGYVFSHDLTQDFMARLTSFLEFLLPQYQQEGKTMLTIAIGCTGGQHRSVAMVEALRVQLAAHGLPLETRHRELAGRG